MQGHRFPEATTRVLADAREKAWTLTHEMVRPGHLLFGLARSKDRTLLQLWARLDIDPDEVGRAALANLPPGNPESDDTHPPFTSFSKRVIEFAMREASALGDDTVEPTHILLGVIQLGDDTVARVLRERGVTADGVRAAFGDVRGRLVPEVVVTSIAVNVLLRDGAVIHKTFEGGDPAVLSFLSPYLRRSSQ
jgi:ATP-dependent Clp protease ATP-binding subunit ClpA